MRKIRFTSLVAVGLLVVVFIDQVISIPVPRPNDEDGKTFQLFDKHLCDNLLSNVIWVKN